LAGADRTASLVQSDQMSVPVTSDASEPSRAQTEVARALAEPQAPKSQIASDTSSLSFDEVSSSFVSSLVGGAARPVETVMDWISLQPMERPAPLAPHQVRLDAGAVQVEIQRMVRQGGGQVVMELTPPDQSKFTIELRLDDKGGASLVVEGVSDSTRARLEQSAPQLHQQFEQMGLSLQLDMRQQRDTMSSSDRQGQEGSAAAADHKNADVKGLAVESRNRQRALSEGQIHLYA